MKIKILKGNHFEINKQISLYFKKDFNKSKLKSISSDKIEKIINILKKNHPTILDEIRGRTEGFDCSISDFLALTAYELYDKNEDRCTDLYVVENSRKGIFHNEDGSEEIKVFLCQYEDEKILDLSCYSCLHGTTFSATKNLMMSVNYIYNDRYNFDANLPTWIFARLVLTCKNIKEVKALLKKYSIWGSISINLLDVNANKLYSIEKHDNINSIKEIKELYYKTNTFIHPEMQPYIEEAEEVNTSHTRYKKLEELLKNCNLSYEQIMLYNNGNDYESVRVTGKNLYNAITQITVFYCKDKIEFINKKGKKKSFLTNEIL